MSDHFHDEYQDDCPGCRPAMLDVNTGKPLPADHPAMVAINKVFDGLTMEQKQAWFRVTCKNSRAPADLEVIREIQLKMEAMDQKAN